MDAKLRELERRSLTDLDAAQKLITSLKRLIQGQWQAFGCPTCKYGDVITAGCSVCDGRGWVRCDVLELCEYSIVKKHG